VNKNATTEKPRTRANWCSSEYATRYFEIERAFIDAGLRQSVGPSVLQLGQCLPKFVVGNLDLPFLITANKSADGSSDIVVDPAFLPFSNEVFSTVVLPHVLEMHELPHQVLREAHRVMMPEGHVVLTGFNPLSLLGVQRWLRPNTVSPGRYYPVRRVTDWLQLLGFEVVASSVFQYAPLTKSNRLKSAFQFLESVGDRWLPIAGGGYMISAKKRESGAIMVGRSRFKATAPKLVSATVAKDSKRTKE
jgi:SAM-dependent methyltransferase